MNLYTNIKFSNNLIGNKCCTITYSGYLYENNSQSVRIVYGYGNNWQHTTEQLMEKTENGFEAKINILDYDSFNFCFRNEVYEWDNNYNQNYSAPISKDILQEEFETVEDFIINENVLPEILDNISSIDLSSEEPKQNEIISEKTVEIDKTSTIDESSLDSMSFDISIEKNEPISIEDSLVNSFEIESLNNDLDALFADLYSVSTTLNEHTIQTFETANPIISQTEDSIQNQNVVHFNSISVVEPQEESFEQTIETTNKFSKNTSFENIDQTSSESIFENNDVEFDDIISNNFNMNNLIDEILSPIVNSCLFEEESLNSLKDFTSDITNENFFESFEENEDDISVDNKIDNLIADLFSNTKEVESANTSALQNNAETIVETSTSFFEETTITENTQELESQNKIIEPLIKTTSSENISEETKKFESSIENEKDSFINSIDDCTSLIEVSNSNNFIVSPRTLGKFYMFKKKVKLAFAKLFSLPKILGRNFNRGTN